MGALQPWERQYWVAQARQWGMTGIKPADILADEDGQYNCISYALGRTDVWLWPGMRDWPNADRTSTLETFHTLLESLGYTLTERPKRFQPEAAYVVLYEQDGRITHATRRDGRGWLSKCGRGATIKHTRLEQVSGCYGTPRYVFRRSA